MSGSEILSLTAPKIARLLCIDPALAWRQSRAGLYGPALKGKGWPRFSIAEIERRTGRFFTPQQVEAAFASPAHLTSSKRKAARDAAEARRDLDYKRSLLSAMLAVQAAVHAKWVAWICDPEARHVQPNGPPPEPDEGVPTQILPRLYTEKEMETAIDRTVAARDADWERWRSTPARALFTKPLRGPDYFPRVMFDRLKG